MLFLIKLYYCDTAVHLYNIGGLKRLGLKKENKSRRHHSSVQKYGSLNFPMMHSLVHVCLPT